MKEYIRDNNIIIKTLEPCPLYQYALILDKRKHTINRIILKKRIDIDA